MGRLSKFFLLAPIAAITFACSESILELENQSQYTEETYFRDAAQYNEAVIAQYSNYKGAGLYSRDYYFIIDLLGNDAQPAPPLLGNEGAIARYGHSPTTTLINNLWVGLYRSALRANFALDRLNSWDATAATDVALKKQYIAESKFNRAYAYDQLTTLWGDVPLRSSYADHLNYSIPRSPSAEVYTFIEQDLADAIADLPVSYSGDDQGRATRGAAQALLGRVHLHQGDFAAAKEALEPLAPGKDHPYRLVDDYDTQFSVNNKLSPETLFDVNHKWSGWGSGNAFYMFGGQEWWGGKTTHTGRAQEYGFRDWANVTFSKSVAMQFMYKDQDGEDYTDPRAAFTFYSPEEFGGDRDFCKTSVDDTRTKVCTETQPYEGSALQWRKYELYEYMPSGGTPDSEINSQLIRYADVLLMLGEAHIETGDVSGGIELINRVRRRVGAFEYSDISDQGRARDIVRRERALELSGEQSRWFDLKRWGTAVQQLNADEALEPATKTAEFQPFMVLLPIPQSETSANSSVVVEGGWN